MIINTEEMYILEWSGSQRKFSVSPLAMGLSNNQMALMEQCPTSFSTLWIGPRESCEVMAERWQRRLHAPAKSMEIVGVPV